jgi:predicted NBD/HSP70 family sugar kinase
VNASRSPLVRQYSRRLVAEILLKGEPISRADLARTTGLSKQTMSEVIGELEAGGWVRPVGITTGGPGRNAVTFEIAAEAAFSLGVDLGGTKISAALADLLGEIVAEATEPTDSRGGRYVLNQIHRLALRLAAERGIDATRIGSVVVGSPGVLDRASGAISLVPNIRGLSEIDVVATLSGLFDRPVAIENDVNLAMLGEAWQGCARGCENAAFLSLGTGTGLGLIVNGKLIRGATGAAGEISYLPVGPELRSAEALTVGAFELEVGSHAIVRRFRAKGGEGAETVRDVFARLNSGDTIAAAVLDETAQSLSLAVAALCSILDPEMIVMGGSIGMRPELLARISAELPQVFARPVVVVPSALGNRAGLVGALSSAVSTLHNQLFGMAGLPGEIALPGAPIARAAE